MLEYDVATEETDVHNEEIKDFTPTETYVIKVFE